MLSKFAKTLVEIARHREARRDAILSEQAKRIQESEKKRKAEELAEHSYEEEIFREAQRQNWLEQQARLRQVQLNNDRRTGLWMTVIAQKNLEIGLDGMERILADIRNPGLRKDLLEGLGFLANLAGNDAVSYDTIKERVIPVLVEEARDELRRKLAGNSYQEYFASLIGFNSSA